MKSRTCIGRVCHDCGATAREVTFPGTRKQHRKIDRCTDCLTARERLDEATPAHPTARPIRTRAAYRAAYRYRAKQAQGDLVDLVVPPP